MGIKEIIEISKPRIVILLVITAATSMYAASKLIASPLYELFINLLKEKKIHVRTGQFGADMNIQLNNNGPVTIIVEQ